LHLNIDGLNINYEIEGQGKDVLVLHGWGANMDVMRPIASFLSNHFRVASFDFPGFGMSQEPPVPWSVYDYAEFTEKFIKAVGLNSPVLIGHSFGGRVIICLAGKMGMKVPKIVLVDSAGIKPRRSAKYYLKVCTFKTLKNILKLPLFGNNSDKLIEKARKKFGSSDYKNVSGIMRQTMVKVVNEDLKQFLPSIRVPTLLIWGENDAATPLRDAKIMEKLIPDSGLVVLKNAGHFSFLDKTYEFNTIVYNFLSN